MAQPMAAYGTWPPELPKDDTSKPQAKSQWRARVNSPPGIIVLAGSFLMVMLSIAPVWNAVSLLQDFNYVYWVGRRTPHVMIILCILVVLLYFITSSVFFNSSSISTHTEHNILMLANIFITLCGLFLMLVSMPLAWQAELTSGNLMYNCAASEQTHRSYEFSQVLHNMRATPACASKFSVEECAGYQAAPPYTDYLKNMENTFRCAGFCYKAPPASAPAAAAANASKLSGIQSDSELSASATYPPTLFSDSNFQASCDGMASRDMLNMAGDIGHQTFYQGIYLVLIAVATGFLNLLGFCFCKG